MEGEPTAAGANAIVDMRQLSSRRREIIVFLLVRFDAAFAFDMVLTVMQLNDDEVSSSVTVVWYERYLRFL